MAEKILDGDFNEGGFIKREIWTEDDDDQTIVLNSQDCTDIYTHNKYQRDNLGKGTGNFRKVASIPLIEYEKLMISGRDKDPVAMRRWLDDPVNRRFRTNTLYLGK